MQIIQKLISRNFDKGRTSYKWIALHKQEGNGSLYPYFDRIEPIASKRTSSNYWVGKLGQCEQYVKDEDTSYCTYGINARSISIEFEGFANDVVTDAQYQTGSELVALLSNNHNIPTRYINRDGIIAEQNGVVIHRDVPNNSTSCPANLDYMRIINGANSIINGTNMFDFKLTLSGLTTTLEITSGSCNTDAIVKNLTKGTSWLVHVNGGIGHTAPMNTDTEQCLYEVNLNGVTHQLDNRPITPPVDKDAIIADLNTQLNTVKGILNEKNTQISGLNGVISDLNTKLDNSLTLSNQNELKVKDLTIKLSEANAKVPSDTQTVIERSRLETLEAEDVQFQAIKDQNTALQKTNEELTAKLSLYEGSQGLVQAILNFLKKIFNKGN